MKDVSAYQQPKVGIARFNGTEYVCNCGYETKHHRRKVIEDRLDLHFKKKHGGQGLRI